jgi:hypothetical protein
MNIHLFTTAYRKLSILAMKSDQDYTSILKRFSRAVVLPMHEAGSV